MGRAPRMVVVVLGALGVLGPGFVGCGNLDEYYSASAGDSGAERARLSRHSRGSAIDISEDDSRVIAVNRDEGTVSVFAASYPPTGPVLERLDELNPVCGSGRGAGKPWQVVLHPDGDRAYVVCREEQFVVEIEGIKSRTPRVSGRRAEVGSEPTGIALTARGTYAWVANWVDGTVERLDTASMTVDPAYTVNLNKVLVDQGYLGDTMKRMPLRRALAHPRSLAISNDGDDDENNEWLVVTEYFAQQRPPDRVADPSDLDGLREGLLYRIRLGSQPPTEVKTIPLEPVSLGATFAPPPPGTAMCFPNQLQSVTINGYRGVGLFAYVTAICASPKGPLAIPAAAPDAKTCVTTPDCQAASIDMQKCIQGKCVDFSNVQRVATPSISIVEIEPKNGEPTLVPNGMIALNHVFWTHYRDTLTDTSDRTTRRLPLLANDVAFLPGGFQSVISAGGADALFRVTFNKSYTTTPITEIGPGPFVGLEGAAETDIGGPIGPIGVAVAHSHEVAFVATEGLRKVVVVALNKAGGTVATSAPSTEHALPDSDARRAAEGKRLFNFGLGKWSSDAQGWGACSECHIDGLTDNVTWSFPRGPRQSISIDGFFEKDVPSPTQRNFGWNASNDEVSDLEVPLIRGFFGGAGLILSGNGVAVGDRVDMTGNAGLDGSSAVLSADTAKAASRKDDWALLVSYLKTIRPPRRPKGLDPQKIKRGRDVATARNCGGCHGGPMWTISKRFYTPGAANGGLRTTFWSPGGSYGFLPTSDPTARTMRYAVTPTDSKLDSLTCALRDVGTYAAHEPGVFVDEKRDNGSRAQGLRDETGSPNVHEPNGYSPPSLFGLAVGAPYFHAGNARTLEAAFGSEFQNHHSALTPTLPALTDDEVSDLVTFLLAIDGRPDQPEQLVVPQTFGAAGGSLCPPTFP